MATTNNQIIESISLELIAQKKIGALDELHTFARWKQLGYAVKKGEHAIATTSLWKKGKDRKNEDGETVPGHLFLAKSFLFATAQVEPIKARG